MRALFLLYLAFGLSLAAPNVSDLLKPAKTSSGPIKKTCKIVPGDKAWPSDEAWAVLSRAVDGNLHKTVPPAAACHATYNGQSTLDGEKCAAVQANWGVQDFHSSHPASILWSHWYGNTCEPTSDLSSPCTIGNLPHYVVEAKSPKYVQAAINFARNSNIRLVIKNTGHDFMEKSTGAGSLSVWTRPLKELEFYEKWTGKKDEYKGSAVKVGAGWQTGALYEELQKRGVMIVGGECDGVGFAGGYFQGGGHSPLSPVLSMAADQVLEVELVTADGRFITANKAENSDVFWALRGGGGASWGVVTSVTVKTFKERTVAGNVLYINSTKNSDDTYWAAITELHKHSIDWVEKDLYIYYELYFNNTVVVKPILGFGKTKKQLEAILKPFYKALDKLGLVYDSTLYGFPSFYAAHKSIFDPEPAGLTMLSSGRIISRADWKKNVKEITNLMRYMNTKATRPRYFLGHILQPGNHGVDLRETSINPAWKTSISLPLWNIDLTGKETQAQLDDAIADIEFYDNKWKKLAPHGSGGGGYLNEANIYDPEWPQEFYGSTWGRLNRIKEKVDPWGVFYAETAIGSQNWEKKGEWDRLCPT